MGPASAMIKAAAMVLGLLLSVTEAQQQFGVSGIIFPDQQISQKQISQNPRCTFNRNDFDENAPCEQDEDYNLSIEDRFRHLLARFRGSQVVRNEIFQDLTQPEEIQKPHTRIRFITETPACAAEETIIYPKRAKTEKEEWVFVLNQGNNRQGVKVEKCISNGQSCNLGAARTEVNSVCRQKYIYKKLLVMNGAGTNIVPESVLMPSCCVCYLKKERNNFGGFNGFRSGIINGGNNFGSNNGQRRNSNQFPNRGINTRING